MYLAAIAIFANEVKGKSALAMSRDLGLAYKSAFVLLHKLREDGLTILIVEHDMEFVMKLVDRLVVMNFGSKLVEGKPAEVRADERVQAAYLGGVA